MSKELMKTVSESLFRLKFLVSTQFLKPLRDTERERNEFPPGYMHVLGWLKSKDVPVSMTDLAGVSCISKPNLTTMVDRLCADGLVERSADVNDRRIVNVALTKKGMDFLHRQREEVARFIEGRLGLLDDPELEKLKHALDDLSDILNRIEEKRANQR